MLGDERFATMASRGEHKAEVDAAVRAWTATMDKMTAMARRRRGRGAGLRVRSTTEVLNDADLRERGIFVAVDYPVRGKVTIPGLPGEDVQVPGSGHGAAAARAAHRRGAAGLAHKKKKKKKKNGRAVIRREVAIAGIGQTEYAKALPGTAWEVAIRRSWPRSTTPGSTPRTSTACAGSRSRSRTVSEPQLVRALGIGELHVLRPISARRRGHRRGHRARRGRGQGAGSRAWSWSTARSASPRAAGLVGRQQVPRRHQQGGAWPTRTPACWSLRRTTARSPGPTGSCRPASCSPCGPKKRHRAPPQRRGSHPGPRRHRHDPAALRQQQPQRDDAGPGKTTAEDYRNARMISEPLRLFDLCLENDGACAYVVTSAETCPARSARTRCTCCWPPRRSALTASRWASTSPASSSSSLFPPATAARLFADACLGTRRTSTWPSSTYATSYMPLRSLES